MISGFKTFLREKLDSLNFHDASQKGTEEMDARNSMRLIRACKTWEKLSFMIQVDDGLSTWRR